MRTVFILLLTLLLGGCSAVDIVDSRETAALQKAGFEQSSMLLAEGGQLSYWQGGEGKPLLLIHGFGGSAVSSWQQVMLALSQDYQVIAPDLAWFGESVSAGTPSLATQTQTIMQLIEQLQLDSVNVVGISYGGFVTFDLMINEPKVDKAVLLASPGVLFSDNELVLMNQRFGVDTPTQIFVPETPKQMRRLLDATFVSFPWYPGFIDADIYDKYFAGHLAEKRLLIDSLPADRDRIAADLLPETLPSSMLIWGENDKVFPLYSGVGLADYLKAPIVVIPDGAHGISNDYPEIVSQSIKAFVQ
ncbi:putative hydrolase YugF [Shewanella sairae]|uniref:Hydrolase YugF n=1 Tax=Shewanella sairae TaxID=190310 RepID=A0ABQ4NZ76_9GAMM|nr:alpha/beta hydrolase [Shewanella sairae]MCL1129137.1 alpha/beta hydrolase [Shewanella sairae]GIU40364.1 putative hydrolase YugF [Shewanella sairae]